MKLSVVILSYNVRYFLELCLKSVEKAIEDLEAEIIVVDNHSSDDSREMVKSQFPKVKLVENNTNYGFSKGNNIAVKKALGEYICILNPDTVVSEDTFQKLLEFADSKENLGILGCRLIDGSGVFLPESKRNVPVPNVAFKKLMGFPKAYYANQIGEFEIGTVPILVGAIMLMKKSVFYEVGGFDEDYFMYGEDIDFSYRITKLGYQNIYLGKVSILHFKGESTLKDHNYAKQFYGAMQVFYEKHFKRNFLFNNMVWIGIRLAFLLRRKHQTTTHKIEKYIFVSKNMPVHLEAVLQKQIHLLPEITKVNEHTEIILDANMLSYKKIIDYISDPKINTKAKFKILPNNSDFIIGSSDSKSRGEVINFGIIN